MNSDPDPVTIPCNPVTLALQVNSSFFSKQLHAATHLRKSYRDEDYRSEGQGSARSTGYFRSAVVDEVGTKPPLCIADRHCEHLPLKLCVCRRHLVEDENLRMRTAVRRPGLPRVVNSVAADRVEFKINDEIVQIYYSESVRHECSSTTLCYIVRLSKDGELSRIEYLQ
ncbi:hypothetical protein PF007_g29877 [Phytophthora fragariae]|uniref:Uncharacterized protein n=1 Tax=Phytophthora fragariae TaxID=53985 RepID=A0A6A3PWC3_9STRA|nr:hypothetical protein PF007_g29877 [Phytophthora fragariae]